MMVAWLAGRKAGGASMPLDPAYPAERLRFMLQDSQPLALLTQKHLEQLFAGLDDNLPVLDMTDPDLWSRQPEANLAPAAVGLTPQRLAYVIYTSGSTGIPKGVLVPHANIVRLFASTESWFHFRADDVWSLFHSYAFDFSVWEIWGALLYSGRLIVVSKEAARAPEEFCRIICRQKVTMLNQTPGAFRQLIAAQANSGEFHTLRHVIFGGEALDTVTLQPWYRQPGNHSTALFNMYGITETTVHVTCRPLCPTDAGRSGASHIGRPIANTRVYILDTHGEPVPVGVAGELYIGGAGVARGYLNRAELTAEKFVPDPFVEEPGARMYRTGDLGRGVADGNSEVLGRNGLQVKIRGFRIELGEIEARLMEHPAVREAVVIAREDTPGDKRLVAYYTDAGEDSLSAEQLRSHLSARLPEYMVPAAYVRLESLPLTPNGKLDRKVLPAPESDAYSTRGYEAPQGETETRLAGIWAEVLKLDRVGRHDNFFALGGHSLLGLTLIERMRRVGLHVDVRALFATPTLAGLASGIDFDAPVIAVPPNLIPAGCEVITPEMVPLVELTVEEIERVAAGVPGGAANVQDIYPLAPLQEGILFHHLLGGEGDPYLLATLHSFDSRERLDGYLKAMQAAIRPPALLRPAVRLG